MNDNEHTKFSWKFTLKRLTKYVGSVFWGEGSEENFPIGLIAEIWVTYQNICIKIIKTLKTKEKISKNLRSSSKAFIVCRRMGKIQIIQYKVCHGVRGPSPRT